MSAATLVLDDRLAAIGLRKFNVRWLWAVLAALSIAPVLFTPIPAMADYPNHLARMYLLTRDNAGDAHPFYQVVWSLYPNLAMDLIIPYAAQWIGVELAGRLFIVLSQILILTGASALERVVKGKIEIAPFAGLIFLYSLPFSWGFLNFEFGLGVALWGLAAMMACQERGFWFRLALHAFFCIALFASHLFSMGVYGLTLGCYELWRAVSGRRSMPTTALRMTLLALPAAGVLAFMLASDGAVGGEGTRWLYYMKPFWFLFILNGYNKWLAIACGVALIFFLFLAFKRGVMRLTGAGPWIAGGIGVAYLVIPYEVFDTACADLRLIPAAALILPAYLTFSLPELRWRVSGAVIASLITLANLICVCITWTYYDAEYRRLITSFEKIEKRSLVLMGYSTDEFTPPTFALEEYPIYNAPTLVVHYADAFTPTFFTAKGKQPIAARSDVSRLDRPYGGVVPSAILKALANGDVPPKSVSEYSRNWQRDYDYLYLIGPDWPNPLPEALEELDRGKRFALYRIRK